MHVEPRVGFVVWDELPVMEAIGFAGEQHFDYVEVKMHGNAERTKLARMADDVTSELDAQDLDLLVHLPWQLDIGSPHEYVRDGSVRELEACIERAAALGGEKAVVHAESRAWIGEGLRRNVFESLRRLDRFASKLDVELCAENPLSGTVPIDSFDQLFDATDVSMTLDTGHARCDGFSSPEIAAFVAEHGHRISHVHLNETRGESDDHLPFGEGTVDFAVILEALPNGWDGTLSLEIKGVGFDAIATSKRRLEHLLAE